MNTTTRTALRLLIATPLAASAIAFGGFAGTAHADGFEPGPIIIAQPHDDDDPKPQGPGDITNPEDNDDPKPEGPDDLTNPEPGDKPEDVPGDDVPADQNDTTDEVAGVEDVQLPNRIDAGAGSDDEGLSLAWVLAGGGVVTAAGSLLARRRMGGATR